MYGPPQLSSHTNRCCLEIARLSCVFWPQGKWPDSDRCRIRWQERDGGKGFGLMSLKLCIVCAGGRIDGWVGGKGAFLNLCVPFFF